MITVLSGGTGSAKLIRGLAKVVPQKEITVIANMGDNIRLYGLTICPDVDTVLYSLAGLIDRKKGWGIAGDTFSFIGMLKTYGEKAWFKIGDKDLATHVLRSQMISRGKSLTEATMLLAKLLKVHFKILPATDSWIETRIISDAGEMHLQEFWVKRKAKVKVVNVVYANIEKATATDEVLDSIKSSEAIIISPANPITSIKPILEVSGMKDALEKTNAKIIGISPFIGRKAFSGPAGKLMRYLGYQVSPLSVAKLYRDFLQIFLVDKQDSRLKNEIEGLGVNCVPANIRMGTPKDEIRLANTVLQALK